MFENRGGINKPWIVLDLANDQDYRIPLPVFDLNSTGTISRRTATTATPIPTALLAATSPATVWTLKATLFGVEEEFKITSQPTTANALRLELDALTGETWQVPVVGPNFGLQTISTLRTYTLFRYNQSTTETDTQINMSAGLGQSTLIQSGMENITYTELVEELTFQPYLLTLLNVYANTMAQANSSLFVENGDPTGTEIKKPYYPRVNPMNEQFVNEDVPIYFLPSPTNNLRYDIKPGESLKLIIFYITRPKLELASTIGKDEFKNEIIQLLDCDKTYELDLLEKSLLSSLDHDDPKADFTLNEFRNTIDNYCRERQEIILPLKSQMPIINLCQR